MKRPGVLLRPAYKKVYLFVTDRRTDPESFLTLSNCMFAGFAEKKRKFLKKIKACFSFGIYYKKVHYLEILCRREGQEDACIGKEPE